MNLPFASGDLPGADDSARLGLIWGFDFTRTKAAPLSAAAALRTPPAGVFRWLHLNLADQWTQRWLGANAMLTPLVRDLLLATDRHQRALVDGDAVACALLDFERDFDVPEVTRTGLLVFAVTPGLMVSARHHPMSAADEMRRRIDLGARPADAAAATELLIGSVTEVATRVSNQLTTIVQAAEDALIDYGHAPDPRALVEVRRRAVLLHRQLTGLRAVLHRLETDEDAPEALHPTFTKLTQRVMALDTDVLQIQGNLRLLREEVDMQTANRTNANFYILSLLTALQLPPTLVTGFFGMNTGGLPFAAEDHGTALAFAAMAGAAIAVFIWLQSRGFFKR